jgi:CBS domain-containing protein
MSIKSLLVSGTMSTDVKKQTADQNIMGACKIMHDHKIGCVVIVELEDPDMKPVGIITERDIVRILGELEPWLNRMPLRTFMSRPVITIEPTASLKKAMDKMNSHNIRRLIVVDNDAKMIGIITEKDIFREMAKNGGLLADFLSTNYSLEHKEIHERFADFISDLLPKF